MFFCASHGAEYSQKLTDAIAISEIELRQWLAREAAWQQLLLEVFGRYKSIDIIGITIETLGGEVMHNLRGAYAAPGATQEEKIYLNSDWIEGASINEITAILLEEMGHAIDTRLNGKQDTQGDEGALFSHLIRGLEVQSHERKEMDHYQLNIQGQPVFVEAARPVLTTDSGPELATIAEDTGVPIGTVGTLVSDLIESSGDLDNFSDSDGDLPGIAITGTNLEGGTLYYSTNNGASWDNVGTVSESSARVLHANNDTRLAFVPEANYAGTIDNLIEFKAWDRTGANKISSSPTVVATLGGVSAQSVTLLANGKHALIGGDSLQIIDISNPRSPQLVSTLETSSYINDVIISRDNKTAYLAKGFSGLTIADISDITNPAIISSLDTADIAFELFISPDEDTLYMANGLDGLRIIDISDPVNPNFIGRRDIGNDSQGLTLSNNGAIAYLAEGNSLTIHDVTNPFLSYFYPPLSDGSLSFNGEFISPTGIKLSGDGQIAYITSSVQDRLAIVDVSEPQNPSVLGSVSTFDAAGDLSLSADGKTAFVTQDTEGVLIVDISDPTSPSILGSIQIELEGVQGVNNIAISDDGKTAFVVADSGELNVVDISDSTTNAHSNGDAEVATNALTLSTIKTDDWAYDVKLSLNGNTAFVADNNGNLQIIDVSDPSSPQLISGVDTAGSSRAVDLSADGQTAFVADGDQGLQIVDISDLNNPSITATLDTSGWAYSVKVSWDGQTAFIADDDSGLHIVDVNTLSNPTPIATLDTTGAALELAISADSNTLFIADELSGLQVVDVSTPTSPALLSTLDTSGSARGISLSADNKTVFIADQESGLQIINVSDPSSPELLATYDTPGIAGDVSLSHDGKTAYVADGENGVEIIDVSTLASPSQIDSFQSSDYSFGVTLSANNNTAYVADREEGLQIVDLSRYQSFSKQTETAQIQISNVNDIPEGIVFITGSATQEETLIAHHTISDGDGLGEITYEWYRDGITIDGEIASTYKLTQQDVGFAITAKANYTDQQGADESVSSTATQVVTNINDLPAGSVAISGLMKEKETLTVSSNITDADGLGPITYQWKRNGHSIPNENLTTYLLSQADVGTTITVTASYTDTFGNHESLTSDETLPIESVDDEATISGDLSSSGAEDTTIRGQITAIDPDGLENRLIYSLTDHPANGQAAIDHISGLWSYRPDPNYFGDDEFKVAITDDTNITTDQIISITVIPVDDTAVIGGDITGSGANDRTAITGTLTATDIEGLTNSNIFSIQTSDHPSFGTAFVARSTGVWTYTPDNDFVGTDSFKVTVTDDLGGTSLKTIDLTITDSVSPASEPAPTPTISPTPAPTPEPAPDSTPAPAPTTAPIPAPDPTPTPAPAVPTPPTAVPVADVVLPEEFSELTADDVASLAPEAIADLGADQIQVLPPEAVLGFSAAQVAQIESEIFAAFNAQQINQLSTEAVTGITRRQMSELSVKAIRGFSGQQLQQIPQPTFKSLQPNQLSRLSEDAVTGLSASQLKTLKGDELTAFKPRLIEAIDAEAIPGLKPSALNELSQRQVKALSNDQLAALSKKQIKRADVFVDALSERQYQALSFDPGRLNRSPATLVSSVDSTLSQSQADQIAINLITTE